MSADRTQPVLRPVDITDEMVERGARVAYDMHRGPGRWDSMVWAHQQYAKGRSVEEADAMYYQVSWQRKEIRAALEAALNG